MKTLARVAVVPAARVPASVLGVVLSLALALAVPALAADPPPSADPHAGHAMSMPMTAGKPTTQAATVPAKKTTTATAPPTTCLPTVRDAWIRKPPMAMPMLAGFATVHNGCATPAAIVSAKSPAFGDVSLHESTEVNGVSRMRAVPKLVVAPGTGAVFKPGSYHLMLMAPKSALVAGQSVPITLVLEDGREVTAPFVVRAPK